MDVKHTPDRTAETVPDEWCHDYDDVNDTAQAYIDWMNGDITKTEYQRMKHSG